MREITEEQLNFITEDLRKRGLAHESLKDSITDHICCIIESRPLGESFERMYNEVIESFGENGLMAIQQETIYLLTLNKNRNMKRTIYFLGYMAAVLCTTGILFKFMHWTGANVLLVSGIILLNIGFLPIFFYDRYKSAISK